MNPLIPKNSGVMTVNPKKGNGTVSFIQAKYQLTPAVTKKAPDKNLKISFIIVLKLIIKNMFCQLLLIFKMVDLMEPTS